MTHPKEDGPARNFWGGREMTWHLLRPPLRPSPIDLGYLRETVREWKQQHERRPRLLLLGVTPEVYQLAEAEGVHLFAADLSREMVRVVWPGPRQRVMCADWTRLPLRGGTRDIASCDGGYILLDQQRQIDFARSLHRVLIPGGRLLLRVFIPREPPEKPEEILDDLRAGKIASVHALKLRFMSCDHGGAGGIRGRDIWRLVHDSIAELPALASKLGWKPESLITLETMRHSDITYFQPSHDDVVRRFTAEPGGFRLLRRERPEYDLGDQAPTYIFQRE